MIALNNRVHIFASPDVKEKLIEFFTDILGCGPAISLDAPGLATPVLAFTFSNGASLSVEFTEDALNKKQAERGAYFELIVDDAPSLKEKILQAGLSRMEYMGNDFFYFQAPGGQVMRILSPDEL